MADLISSDRAKEDRLQYAAEFDLLLIDCTRELTRRRAEFQQATESATTGRLFGLVGTHAETWWHLFWLWVLPLLCRFGFHASRRWIAKHAIAASGMLRPAPAKAVVA